MGVVDRRSSGSRMLCLKLENQEKAFSSDVQHQHFGTCPFVSVDGGLSYGPLEWIMSLIGVLRREKKTKLQCPW